MQKRVLLVILLGCIAYLLFFTEILWSSGSNVFKDDLLKGPRGPFGPLKEIPSRGIRGPFGP